MCVCVCWTGMNQCWEGSVCEQQDKQEFFICACVNRALCVQFMNIKGFWGGDGEFQRSWKLLL